MSEPDKNSSDDDLLFWIVVCLLVVGLLVVAVPNFIKARSTSANNACITNLRQIDAAANQFAMEKDLKKGSKIKFQNDLPPYINLNSAGKIPGCPEGGIYHMGKLGDSPTCTLSTATPAHSLQ